MLTPTEVLELARLYAAAEDCAVSTVGKRAIGNHKIFGRIAGGHSANARTLQQLEVWFRANWPESAPWPSNITPGPLTRRRRRSLPIAECGEPP